MMTGGFKRKSKAASEIPSSSLADMAFLLLIFFMVSTTFRKEQDRDVEFPDAESTKKLDEPRKNVLHIFVERDGQVFINDQNVPMQDVNNIVQPLYTENRELVIVLRADADAKYAAIDAVQKELQEANAVRVTFFTELERRMIRERR
jgi:biopolymer transport protein ExbD